MFEGKKPNYKSKTNKSNYKANNNTNNNIENELSNYKKNNLFNLLQNNNEGNEKDNDNEEYNNNYSNNTPLNSQNINNYNNKNSKKNKYDYNQEFLKKQKEFYDNNNDDEDLNDRNTNSNSYYSKKRPEEDSSESQNKSSSGIFGNYFGVQTDSDYTNYKNKNPSTEVNKYGLAVNISNYETKMSGIEESVFYKIDLYSKLSNKSWSVSHKYMDFFELNLIFEKYYVSPPYCY